jgi:catechol 2,3-dioxygenase-like lactoylglutathione lyase family enzyme
MSFRRTVSVLAAPDLERSGAFYREVLGFEVREIGDPGWRMFVRDGCRILAGACPHAIPAAELDDHLLFRLSRDRGCRRRVQEMVYCLRWSH